MTMIGRKRSRKIFLFHLASWTCYTTHTFTVLQHHHVHRPLPRYNPEVRNNRPSKDETIHVSRYSEDKNLEFLWEDEDDDGEDSQPYRSSPESYKVRQSRQGLMRQTGITVDKNQGSLKRQHGQESSIFHTANDSANHTDTSPTDFVDHAKILRRKSYNATLLSLCQYDYTLYKEKFYNESWQLRINLLRDFRAANGHLFVPARCTVLVNDYTINGTVSGQYSVQLGRWMQQIRKLYKERPNALSSEQIHELNSVGMQFVGVGVGWRPGSFQNYLNMLKDFKDRYGHSNVPRIYPENQPLGFWVEKQRCQFRRYCLGLRSWLTEERVKQLQDLGFDFGYKLDSSSQDSPYAVEALRHNRRAYGIVGEMRYCFERYWQHMFERLSIYKQCHGDCYVPLNYIHDPALGLWVAEQRREFSLLVNSPSIDRKNGLTSLMTVSRFRMLTEIGFNFSAAPDGIDKILPCPWRDIAKQDFDLDLVLSLWPNVPDRVQCIDIKKKEAAILYLFKRRLKWEQLHTAERLSSERGKIKWLSNNESLMEIIGDCFNALEDDHSVGSLLDKEFEWWDNFFDVIRYKRYHGDFDIQPGEIWYSEKLAHWLKTQIDNYARLVGGHMDDIDPVLSERHFQALVDAGFSFHDSENNTTGTKSNGAIKLRRTLQERLGKAPNLSRDRSWLIRFEELRNHLINSKEQSSDTGIASGTFLTLPLDYWVRVQLDQYHRYKSGLKSILTPKRIKLLESIGFKSEAVSNDHEEWSLMIEALKNFKSRYGHCFVSPSWHEKKLGKWLHSVRGSFRRSAFKKTPDFRFITKDQINELETLGVDLYLDDYTWSVLSYDAMFQARLSELRNFKKKFGHTNVTLDYKSPYFELSLWVRELRILYKRRAEGAISTLDSKTIQLLDELQFEWQ